MMPKPIFDKRRRATAERTIAAYVSIKRCSTRDEADMRDLLSDLMHWATAEGKDFDNELRIARDNFEEEIAEIEANRCRKCRSALDLDGYDGLCGRCVR